MIRTTMCARVHDGLPLAASMDDENEMSDLKNHAKVVFKKLSQNSEPRCSIEEGAYVFHYLIDHDVCYLCICDKSYPRKLAFSYLEEISREFLTNYGNEVQRPGLRPYAFVKFDTFIQKTKRVYQDTRASSNLTKLNEDLQDVQRIMTKNMEDLLWRGDSLDRMSNVSDQLRQDSDKYRKDARNLNLQALYRKYGAGALVALLLLLVLYLRFWWF